MKTAKVIIGGGFGDEGKGLFTDYLSSQSERKTCVVRFNGGAQAGHTVETPDGKRHVFSHFGSGSLAGLSTFLSSFFVCSPITFLREQGELAKLGLSPQLYVDPTCPVTTPYDMMINQIVEHTRGHARHGSVGVGFGETLERQENLIELTVQDLFEQDIVREKLNFVRNNWVPKRLKALGVTSVSPEWQERLTSDAILEHFLLDAAKFLSAIDVVDLNQLLSCHHLIFEGAQGLLLDQTYGWFPHVTRSNTGIKNVLSLARELAIKDLDVYYLTRSYTTRHGAGPLPHELPHLPYSKIVDKTTRPHAYQGNLRFAWLDVDLFADTVMRDLGNAPARFNIRTHLGMSCLDQIEGDARYISDGVLYNASAEGLLNTVQRKIGAQSYLASYGPTRATILTSRRVIDRKSNRRFKLVDVDNNYVAAI